MKSRVDASIGRLMERNILRVIPIMAWSSQCPSPQRSFGKCIQKRVVPAAML